MPRYVRSPKVIQGAGTPPKRIEEFVDRVATGTEELLLARMRSHRWPYGSMNLGACGRGAEASATIESSEPSNAMERLATETLKLTVPAHHPIKRSTLAHLLTQARLDVVRFLELV